MDDRLRAAGRAARAEVEAGLDVDAELAALHDRPLSDSTTDTAVRELHHPRRRPTVWLGAAAAIVVLVGGIWLAGDDDTAVEIADPATTAPSATLAPTTAPTGGSVAPTPSTTTPLASTSPPSTTVPDQPIIPPGEIALGPDDLIARAVDGDVWWYPGALSDGPGERILLIDREDPRQQPFEGTGPNFVDHVAGTFRGSLVYGDCCEPVSGNLFAITEPGAEADLWRSPGSTSERATLWGLGYEPRFEPGATRVLAWNWDIVKVVDLATGTDQHLMTSDADLGGLGATWAGDDVAVLGWSFDEGLVLSTREADDLTDELERLVLEPPAEEVPSAGIVGSAPGSVTVFVRDAGGPLRLIPIATQTWTISDARFAFEVPVDATSLHLAVDGNLATWVDGERGVVQRVGEAPFVLDDGLAEVWIPEIRGEPATPAPATTTPPTTPSETDVPSTTIPTPAVPVVDWRDLRYEASGIANSCVGSSTDCTRIVHDTEGTPISYDPTSRVLIRHSVPAVSATMPESYGPTPRLHHAGPDGVVYVLVEPADATTGPSDLVAVSLADGDAGREIARWSGAEHSSERELVATRDGLVDVVCCVPDPRRPSPDAELFAPWVDRNGNETDSEAPSITATVGAEMTITRVDAVPAERREWSFRPPGEWTGRVMPQVTATLDGGFVAAFPTALPEGPGVTIVRGWPDGEVEQISYLTNEPTVALDRNGRVLIGAGDIVWRVDPFDDRTTRPAEGVDVDVEAGTVTLPELAGIEASWRQDPVAFADAVRGPLAVNELRTIEAVPTSDREWLVTVTTSNFFDDSVFADRWELVLERGDDGRFSFVSGTWANSCQPGRGHQDFRNALCA